MKKIAELLPTATPRKVTYLPVEVKSLIVETSMTVDVLVATGVLLVDPFTGHAMINPKAVVDSQETFGIQTQDDYEKRKAKSN